MIDRFLIDQTALIVYWLMLHQMWHMRKHANHVTTRRPQAECLRSVGLWLDGSMRHVRTVSTEARHQSAILVRKVSTGSDQTWLDLNKLIYIQLQLHWRVKVRYRPSIAKQLGSDLNRAKTRQPGSGRPWAGRSGPWWPDWGTKRDQQGNYTPCCRIEQEE